MKNNKKTDEDILHQARKRFRQVVEAESKQRDLEEDDIRFRHGDQWHQSDKNERKDRPCLVINKLEQRVDQVTGDQRMNRMGAIVRQTQVAASNSQDFSLDEVYSGIIKNIEYQSDAKSAYDTAFDHSVGHGRGYWRILTEYSDDSTFDQDIKIKRIPNHFRVYLDPSAEEQTKIDAKWGFITRLVDKKDYPDANWEQGKGEEYQHWFDGTKVRIAEYFRLVPENQVIWLFDDPVANKTNVVAVVKDSKSDIRDELKADGIVPKREREVEGWRCEWYELSCNEVFKRKDFPSKYIPIIPCYGKELCHEGYTYYRGVIRYAKDPQRVYNYTRSASVEQTMLTPKAPYIIEEKQLGNHGAMWQNANVKNYSALVYKFKPGVPPPQRQMPPQPSAGWLAESSIADQDIDASSGMYKASLGAPSNERSGKAINERKMEGDVGTYHYHDNRAKSLQHSYLILLDMIPRVYDTQRVVMIRRFDKQKGKDDAVPVEINKTITDSETGEVVKMYDLSVGKYEVAVDIGASYTTQRQMASESMMELIQYAPQIADRVIDIIARNLDWPGADEISERLQDKRPSEAQMQQIIQEAVAKAINSEELQIKKFDAKTKRIKTIGDILSDGDKIEVELLKILDENNITDEEVRSQAMQIVNQMGEELMAANINIEAQLPPPETQQAGQAIQ